MDQAGLIGGAQPEVAKPAKPSRCWRWSLLAMFSAAMIACTSAEVIVTKVLNYDYKVTLPILSAMFTQSYSVIAGVVYASMVLQEGKWNMTWLKLGKLCLVGANSAASAGLRAWGINAIPGSIFVVVCSLDLTFTTILTRIFLPHKTFTWAHYTAAALATGAMVVVAFGKKADDTRYVCDGDSCFDDWTPGMLASAGSALLSAVNSLLSAFVLGEDKTSGLIGSVELAFFYSAVPTLLLPAVAFIFNEPLRPRTGWVVTFKTVGTSSTILAAIFCCYVSTGLAKFGSRMFRFQILSMKGPFFFSLVNVASRLVTAGIAIVALSEGFNWNKGVALAVVVVALGIYSYGSYTNMQAAKQAMLEHEREQAAGVLAHGQQGAGEMGYQQTASKSPPPDECNPLDGDGESSVLILERGDSMGSVSSRKSSSSGGAVRVALAARSSSSLNAPLIDGNGVDYDEAFIMPGDSQQVHRASEGIE